MVAELAEAAQALPETAAAAHAPAETTGAAQHHMENVAAAQADTQPHGEDLAGGLQAAVQTADTVQLAARFSDAISTL